MQKFLSAKCYKLLPSGGQIGKGQGSQPVFRIQDLYRIATANLLVRAGLPADFVSRVLQFIEDEDLISFGPDAPGRSPPLQEPFGCNANLVGRRVEWR